MTERKYFVYILASKKNGTLYIGITNNLLRRIWEHREGLIEGFTKKYSIKSLVYYEEFFRIEEALSREKQLKGWIRKRKLELIESCNENWDDLYDTLL